MKNYIIKEIKIAKELFGSYETIASYLKISMYSVRNWAKGKSIPPADKFLELQNLITGIDGRKLLQRHDREACNNTVIYNHETETYNKKILHNDVTAIKPIFSNSDVTEEDEKLAKEEQKKIKPIEKYDPKETWEKYMPKKYNFDFFIGHRDLKEYFLIWIGEKIRDKKVILGEKDVNEKIESLYKYLEKNVKKPEVKSDVTTSKTHSQESKEKSVMDIVIEKAQEKDRLGKIIV